MPNLELKLKKDLSAGRKLALGTWSTTRNPNIYGKLVVRMEESLRYVEAFRKAKNRRITVTHLMAKALAEVFRQVPEANAIIRGNRLYIRDSVTIFLPVALKDEENSELDISGTKIEDADKKSLEEICIDMDSHLQTVRDRTDKDLESSRKLIKRLPHFLIRPFLWLVSFLSLGLNFNLSALGIPKDAFGSVWITNIGSLGLDEGYAPTTPYSRIAMIIAMGAVKDEPVVEDGNVVVGKTMALHATIDHRILDGAHAAVMARVIKDWMENPFEHFDPLD